MNKEVKELKLMLKALMDKKEEIGEVIYELDYFLRNYYKKFRNEESIMALNRIKDFFEKKHVETKVIKTEIRKNYEKLVSICDHDVVIKNENDFCWCLICNGRFRGKDMTNNYCFAVNTVGSSSETIKEIKDFVNTAVCSDGDFIKIIGEKLEKIQYEDDVKVYRRSL